MAMSDLALIEPLLTLLGVLSKSSKGQRSERIRGMHQSCQELFDRANMAVQNANIASVGWEQQYITDGTAPQERESIEDFLQRMDNMGSGYEMELDSIPSDVSREFALAVEQQFQESVKV